MESGVGVWGRGEGDIPAHRGWDDGSPVAMRQESGSGSCGSEASGCLSSHRCTIFARRTSRTVDQEVSFPRPSRHCQVEQASMSLLALKDKLRRLPKAARRAYRLDANSLIDGYDQLLRTGPTRSQGYLSSTRAGIPSSGERSTRQEEHLAIGLFNLGKLETEAGQQIKLVDYQLPLKSVRADAGIGKVDLLGLRADGRLVVIELKVADSVEDCRVALIEGLIYAAIIERNAQRIAHEIAAHRLLPALPARPGVLVVAPPTFWERRGTSDEYYDLVATSRHLSTAMPIVIELTILDGAKLASFGLQGARPIIDGIPKLIALYY